MYQILKRTLSSSNVNASEQIHDFIKIQQNALKDQIPLLKRDVTKSSMIFPEKYKESTLRLCVDTVSLDFFEENRILNWCDGCRFLLPVWVENDGNSLLHSLSVYMYGVQDKRFVLRQLLYQRLFMEGTRGLLRQRWMIKSSSRSKISWSDVIGMASEKKLNNLSNIHIFTMSNILARPIIVLGEEEDVDDELSSVTGVYLPFLRDPQDCEKSPIILGHRNGQFFPLISSENLEIPLCKNNSSPDSLHCIPLFNSYLNVLPVKFLLPKEEFKSMEHMNAFIDIVRVGDTNRRMVPAAMLKFKAPPAYSIELLWSLEQSSQNNVNIGENTYNDLQNVIVENNYQSLIPCANQPLGCTNNESSKNQQHLCIDCNNSLLSANNETLCSQNAFGCGNVASNNPQKMCDHCYNALVNQNNTVTSQSPDLIVSNTQPLKCKELYCENSGIPELQGICQKCYFLRNSEKSVNAENQNYDILNNFPKDQERPTSAHYDRLADNKERPTSAHYDRLADNKERPTSAHNDILADTTAMRNRPLPPTPFYNDNMTVSEVPQDNAAAYVTGIGDSIRKKVCCAVAGCTNSIGSDDIHCNECNPSVDSNKSTIKRECIMEGCTNTANINDDWLCMVCLQSQKHIVRENRILDQQPNFRGGAFDVRSLVHELPPVRIPDDIHQQKHNSAPFISNISNFPNIPNIPRIPTSNMTPSANHEQMGAPPFKPPMYTGFEGFDKQMPTQNAALNWQKRESLPNISADSTKCLHCDNHANSVKGGLCNECFRQKEVGAKQESAGLKCVNDGCKGEGREIFSFLCEQCYKKHIDALKPDVQQQTELNRGQENLLNQNAQFGPPQNIHDINMFGSNVNERQMNHIHNYPAANNTPSTANYPPNTGHYRPNTGNYPPNTGNYPPNTGNYPPNAGNYPPDIGNYPPYAENLIRNQTPPVNTGTTGFPVFQNQQPGDVRPFYPLNFGDVRPFYPVNPEIDPSQPIQLQNVSYDPRLFRGTNTENIFSQVPAVTVPPVQALPVQIPVASMKRENCKGLSCEFFGGEEYGGYCSGCFLNITKTEAEKQNNLRMHAPPDADPQQVPNVEIPPRCIGFQCENFGSNQRMGYCSQCAQIYLTGN